MFKVLAILGAVPALVAMAILDRADSARPEPRSALRRVALVGALSTLPAGGVELVLMKIGPNAGLVGAFYMAFVIAALVEEVCKALCVRWFVWHRPEFDERTDGIVYGARAGLGFALLENIGYLLLTTSNSALFAMLLARSVLTVPMHAMTGAMIGHFAAWRRFEGTGPGVGGGLLLAITLHGVFDVGIFALPVLMEDKNYGAVLVAILCPVAVVVYGLRWIRRAWRAAIEADGRARLTGAATPVVDGV